MGIQPIELPPTTTQPPTPVPNRVLPYILDIFDKNAIKATRAELVVLALVSLIVVGQLTRLVWSLWRRGAFVTPIVTQEAEKRKKVAIVLPVEPNTDSSTATDLLDSFAVLTSTGTDGDGEPTLRFRLRRRSSWGGRPVDVQLDTHGGRRKSAGPLGNAQESDEDGNAEGEKSDAHSLLGKLAPGPAPEPEQPEAGHGKLAALADMGSLGPEPATPTMLPLSVTEACENNGMSREEEDVTELRGLDAPRPRPAAELLAAEASSAVKPGSPRSPRSPRVLAADQAAMMGALLNAPEDQDVDWKAERPSPPVVGAEADVPSLAFGFEDPLGVNRLVGSSEKDEKDDEEQQAVELEARRRESRVV